MIQIFASGNLTRDAVLRQTGNEDVCSFSVACNKKIKGEEKVLFLDCSIWGSRGGKLVQHLTKGKRVCVAGELSTRDHDGKTYLQIRVSEIDFMSSSGKPSLETKPASNDDDIGF